MTTLRLMFATLGLVACADSADRTEHAAPHWEYSGAAGPEHWASLDPAFRACTGGKSQSPIDVTGTVDVDLPALTFDYGTAATEILHNGHTIQVPFPAGNAVTVDGRSYGLKQFHFHAPSEHHVAGRSYPLEAHLVHADSGGGLLVVGVFFEQGPTNPALARLWVHMPPVAGETHPLAAPLLPSLLLPMERDSYRFTGSLTTPPCSEGVQWIVLREPVTASAGQVDLITAALGEANNRPLQALNDRVVYR